ncbi:MAG: acetylxylan esterase, partial [bacterium]
MNFFKVIQSKFISTMVLFTFTCILAGFACKTKLPPVEKLPRQADLPDPMKMMDGTPINTKEDWYNKRRPELKLLFQHYMYGYLPPKPPMNITLVKEDENLFGGKATYKEIKLDLQLPENKIHTIHLALFVPNERTKPSPV